MPLLTLFGSGDMLRIGAKVNESFLFYPHFELCFLLIFSYADKINNNMYPFFRFRQM
mgnify:CR=1 FL=1